MQLTSRERIERVFQNKEIDRPVFKLWGAGLNTEWALHPAYLPVNRLAGTVWRPTLPKRIIRTGGTITPFSIPRKGIFT